MRSRESIIEKIRQAKNTSSTTHTEYSADLQKWIGEDTDIEKLRTRFRKQAIALGSRIEELSDPSGFSDWFRTSFPEARKVVSFSTKYKGNLDMEKPVRKEWNGIDVSILDGDFGVAENGAVWLQDIGWSRRVVPFICQHLVLTLSHDKILPNMHHAYERIQANDPGFGIFVAGPSKTADIEQSLVIGAQAARSLTIVLLT